LVTTTLTSDIQLDAVLHALADPTRRALLARLSHGSERVTALAEPFDMALPTVSKHIRVLEAAGLIQRSVRGREHHCALSVAPLRDIDAWLAYYRPFWSETLDALADYTERTPRKPARRRSPSRPKRR
jgi:DNA-binding transcriptional ArsR family regulator